MNLILFSKDLISLSESFYYVKYGSSIITSKILSNENKKTGVSRKIVCFGILIHVLSWRQQKHMCFCFHYWDFFTNFWRNNWQSIFDVVEILCLKFLNCPRYFAHGKSCVNFHKVFVFQQHLFTFISRPHGRYEYGLYKN